MKIRPQILAVIMLLAGGFAVFFGLLMNAGAGFELVKAQGPDGIGATSTRLTLQPGVVAEGAIGEFQLIADVFPTGMSGLILSVQPVNPAVAEVIGFVTPGYGIVREATSTDPGGLRLLIADLQDLVRPDDIDVLVTTVRIQSLAVGATDFTVSIFVADDDAGFPIQLFGISALITVATDRDLDGDGLTEDFNGNGRFDFDDIVTLFELLVLR